MKKTTLFSENKIKSKGLQIYIHYQSKSQLVGVKYNYYYYRNIK